MKPARAGWLHVRLRNNMGAVSQFEDMMERVAEGLASCTKVLLRGGTLGERQTRELSELLSRCDRTLRELTAIKPLTKSTKASLALQIQKLRQENTGLLKERDKLMAHLRAAERKRVLLLAENARERQRLERQLTSVKRRFEELRRYRLDPNAFYDQNPPDADSKDA